MTTPPSPFRIELLHDDARARVVCAGELDMAVADMLADALAAQMQDDKAVVVDLAEVSFMDSSGLTVLVQAIDSAKVNGWSLSLAPDFQDPVRKLFELTGVTAILPIAEAS